jgi:hypothetical protein
MVRDFYLTSSQWFVVSSQLLVVRGVLTWLQPGAMRRRSFQPFPVHSQRRELTEQERSD